MRILLVTVIYPEMSGIFEAGLSETTVENGDENTLRVKVVSQNI